MNYFAPGVTITQGGQQSCVVFCAYHGSFTDSANSKVFYGVIPDLGGGCANGCGGSDQFGNTTSVSSHEMIEAVTDSDVGENNLVTPLGVPPNALTASSAATVRRLARDVPGAPVCNAAMLSRDSAAVLVRSSFVSSRLRSSLGASYAAR